MKKTIFLFLSIILIVNVNAQFDSLKLSNVSTEEKSNDETETENFSYLQEKSSNNIEWETSFMPGIGYTAYQPEISDSIGMFRGVTVEYLIYGQIHQNDESGPSHVRVYGKLSILNSDSKNTSSLFLYTIGIDLSLEKNPNREFMIPYFGLETGYMAQKQLGRIYQFTPTFGIHIFSKENLFINVNAGFVYPVSKIEIMKGWTGQIGVNFALW